MTERKKFVKLKPLKELRRLGYKVEFSEDGSQVFVSHAKSGHKLGFDSEIFNEPHLVTDVATIHTNALIPFPDAFFLV